MGPNSSISITVFTLIEIHSQILHLDLCKILLVANDNNSLHCSRILYNHLPKIFAVNLLPNFRKYVTQSDQIFH